MYEKYSSVDYRSLQNSFQNVLAWLDGLGINARRGRFGSYEKSIDELIRIYEGGDDQSIQDAFLGIVNAIYEVYEILHIYEGLRDLDLSKNIISKLEEIVKGPVSYLSENASSSNRARNLSFELLIASRLATAGLDLHPGTGGESDAACIYDDNTIFFECKRPRKKSSVRSNAKGASRQLDNLYSSNKVSQSYGIIAMDLTLVINPRFDLLDGKSPSGIGNFLSESLNAFLKDKKGLWRSVAIGHTIAVLLRLSVVAIDRSSRSRLTYGQQYNLMPLSEDNSKIDMLRSLVQKMSNT